jgi:hypothetical protein
MHAYGCINPLNPQSTEIALFGFTVSVGVAKAFFNRVFSNRPHVFSTTKGSFGQLQDFLFPGS